MDPSLRWDDDSYFLIGRRSAVWTGTERAIKADSAAAKAARQRAAGVPLDGKLKEVVIPAKPGPNYEGDDHSASTENWVPAFAGMTTRDLGRADPEQA